MRIKESDIADAVVKWLTPEWEIYPEVPLPIVGCGTVDIVAIKREPPILWFIETKTSMSKTLIQQGIRHFLFADRVSIAVPKSRVKTNRIERLTAINEKHREYGERLGLIYIDHCNGDCEEIIDSINTTPHFIGDHYREYLLNLPEKMKDYKKPGTVAGGVLTPFRDTCDQIAEYVTAHPGCTVKELITNIDHHYCSDKTARSAICTRNILIERKSGIVYKLVKGQYHLYPAKTEGDFE